METNKENHPEEQVLKSPVKIGCVGDLRYENGRKIQETIFKLKTKYPNLAIYSSGKRIGAEVYVKKYSLEFAVEFHEYSFEKTLYSIAGIKGYKYKDIFQKNRIMAGKIDAAVIFQYYKTDYDIVHFIKCIKKLNKPFKIISK